MRSRSRQHQIDDSSAYGDLGMEYVTKKSADEEKYTKFVSAVDHEHVIEGQLLYDVKQIVLYAGYMDPRGIVDPRRVAELLQRDGTKVKEDILADMQLIQTPWDWLQGIKLRGRHPDVAEESVESMFIAHGGASVVQRGIELSLLEVGRDHPVAWTVWSQLGNTWRATGNVYKAIQCFRRALALKADEPDVLLNLAVMMTNVGHLSDARKLIEAAVRLAPKGPLYRFVLGNVMYQLGFVREATEAYRRCLQLDPSFVHAAQKLSSIAAMSGLGHGVPPMVGNESAGWMYFPLTLNGATVVLLLASIGGAMILLNLDTGVSSSSKSRSSRTRRSTGATMPLRRRRRTKK